MASDYPIHLKEFSGAILFDACDVEAIQKMEIRDDDTWVLSFPRSGNFTIQRHSNAQPTALKARRTICHISTTELHREDWLELCHLTLNAPIATKVVCFSRLLKYLRSLYSKQCGPGSDCSDRSSLFWVHDVCFFT